MATVSRPRVLITGGDGQLGWELARALEGRAEVFALDRRAMDLSRADDIRVRCSEINPALILNAGAYTAVDKAESEAELAMKINGEAPAILAEEAEKRSIPLVHYSTDYVFDGNGSRPYVEEDATAPQNVYGRTKLAGEQAVAGTAKRALLFRTSWLYSHRRQNFLLTMQRLARERDQLRVVADQVGSPTWVRTLAEATLKSLVLNEGDVDLAIPAGLYHATASGNTSWHGFASAILATGDDPARRAREVLPISTADFPTPAKRPAYSVLSTAKLDAALGSPMPDWQAQLAAYFAAGR